MISFSRAIVYVFRYLFDYQSILTVFLFSFRPSKLTFGIYWFSICESCLWRADKNSRIVREESTLSDHTSTDKPSSATTPTQDKYPVKRGFTGHLFNILGMTGTLLLVRFRSQGRANIPKKAPYVIAANHQTYIDGMWLAHFLPRKHFKVMCCLAGSDLETSHGPLGKIIMHVGRGIAVDRYGNPVRGLIKAKKEIENGHIMLVHPEGTRTSDGKVAELKDGAGYMAVKANVPLLPVYIEGGYAVFSRHTKYPKPWDKEKHRRKRVTVHYGKPLLPADYDNNAHKITAALSDWMLGMEAYLQENPTV